MVYFKLPKRRLSSLLFFRLPSPTLVLLGAFIISIPSDKACARWATPEDADSEIVFENTEIQINSDGSYTETIEHQVKILKENARENMTTQRLIYNAATSTMKVLTAKTIYEGKEYPVDPKLLEDKPLASSPQGFDQHNQILIAFPQVKINSEIYLKYVTQVKESPIPGFFSTSFVYGTDGYEKAGAVHIRSQKPIFIAANDPKNVLKITEKHLSGDPFKNHIEILLKRPILAEPIDEQNVHLDPKTRTWVDISTSRDWVEMARPMVGKYEEILNQPLPPLFEKILHAAKSKTSQIDQMNTVTSLLSENINYLGDWRPISGLYIPRSLDAVATTKLADCKDFSAATAAILRKLGFTAHIAWIKRGLGAYDSPNNIPTLTEFNHAIVRVMTPKQVIWLDPTNFSSFSQGLYPDISDRKTLIMDPKEVTLDKTPALQATDGLITLKKEIVLNPENHFKVDGVIEMTGIASIPYTGISLKASKQSIDYGLIKAMGDENRISDWSVEDYDLSSRSVQDIRFKFHFKEHDEDLKTSSGPAIILSSGSYIPILLTKTSNRVSDLFLGTPLSIRRELFIKNIMRLGNQPLNCNIESPWITASRLVSDQAEGVQVVDQIIIKKSNIPNRELFTSDFANLQKSLQNCFNGVAIVYSKETSRPIIR